MAPGVSIKHNIARHQVMKYLNSTPLSVPQVPRVTLKQLGAFLESHSSYPFTIIRHFCTFTCVLSWCIIWCWIRLMHLLDVFHKFEKVSDLIWDLAGFGSQGKHPVALQGSRAVTSRHIRICVVWMKPWCPKQLDDAPFFMKGCCCFNFWKRMRHWHSLTFILDLACGI